MCDKAYVCVLVLKRAVCPVGPAPEVRRKGREREREGVCEMFKVFPHKSPSEQG